MVTTNKTVLKAQGIIKERIEKLRDRKQTLYDRIYEKYPRDLYGCKGDYYFDKQSREIDEEIALLRRYDSGLYDLMEILEGK